MISKLLEFEIQSQGFTDIIDVTGKVRRTLQQEGLKEGTVTIFTPGATASVTTIEYESGAVSDLKSAIERMAPENINYKHDARWGDGNGFSHVRAAIIGPSLCVPVENGNLVLGTWQQIVVIDHDNRPRNRRVVIHLLGTG
ncbi:MAG: YjbQ family protein [Deltaproteobacteria bacterium]|nr:YjbQ family protein [Deltaproteobacteria bacterium]